MCISFGNGSQLANLLQWIRMRAIQAIASHHIGTKGKKYHSHNMTSSLIYREKLKYCSCVCPENSNDFYRLSNCEKL